MNTGYKEYAQLAYRRSILSATQRFIQEHLSSEVPPERELLCEEVLASDREVPEEAFLEYLEQIQREEQSIRLQMSQFEFVRKTDVSRKQEEAAPIQPPGQSQGTPARSNK